MLISNSAEIRALVLTHDAGMVAVFTSLFYELGVVTENCGDELKAAEALSRSKFEALVLDFDNMPASFPMIKTLREGRSNKSAVILAVATDSGMKQRAVDQGTNFVFERPFVLPQIKKALRTAYGLMLRDRKPNISGWRLNWRFRY
jgi:CheY-like chemotaxis protein